MNTAVPLREVQFFTFPQARNLAADAAPWVPLSPGRSPSAAKARDGRERPPGKAFKPLRFLRDDRGFVELLRLEPGEEIALHRHTGEVHAFNLQGSRELRTGEIIGPGGYVYEPAGNIDSWKAVGDAPLIVLVVVMGAVEYLGQDGTVSSRYTASRLLEIYREHCETNGLDVLDLVD